MNATTEPRTVHLGRNIKRIREMLQIKHQTLANHLGEDWNQKKISQLEDKEVIDDALLGEVAKALNIPVKPLRSMMKNRTSPISKIIMRGRIQMQPTWVQGHITINALSTQLIN